MQYEKRFQACQQLNPIYDLLIAPHSQLAIKIYLLINQAVYKGQRTSGCYYKHLRKLHQFEFKLQATESQFAR